MGKTAIMAHLYQKYEQENQEDEKQQTENFWAFHFCMNTEGRNTPIQAYRSIISKIGKKLDIQNYKSSLSWKLKELKENIPLFLNGEKLKKQLEKHNFKRLVIAIDAYRRRIWWRGEASLNSFHHISKNMWSFSTPIVSIKI